MIRRRSLVVYSILAALWVAVAGWQVSEHMRIRDLARQALLNHARDISGSLSVVIRSQGRFGFVPRERIEAALLELTESNELRSVALLNSAGEVTASAGEPLDVNLDYLPGAREHWAGETATFVNLVALGSRADETVHENALPVVLPPQTENERHNEFFRHPLFGMLSDSHKLALLRSILSGEPLDEEHVEFLLSAFPPDIMDEDTKRAIQTSLLGAPFGADEMTKVAAILEQSASAREEHQGYGRHRGFPRPPWLSETQYQDLLDKQGVRWFVLTMSTAAYHGECTRDLRLRIIVVAGGLLAIAALGVAWLSMERSARLRVRLARASEMNIHLREMNVAAAGLAHETKNPLNIVRGLAQMISRHGNIPDETRETARKITEEVDRVTERLNRFMDYSRPLKVHPAATDLKCVIRDVARVLETDREDKAVQLAVSGPDLTVRADEALLRQVLFNLVLNALQAVPSGGRIEVIAARQDRDHARFDVVDNGPGVPAEAREAIFRPYFTGSEAGTGLGLAVVRQAALAHQWDVEYVAAGAAGACFRVSGLELV